MLGGEKNLLVAGQRLFERPHARFAAHHERGHHVRKDDDVPDGHHRQTFCIGFFFGSKHVIDESDCQTVRIPEELSFRKPAANRIGSAA